MSEVDDTKDPWWVASVRTLGLPTVFLGALLYMLWCAGSWAATTVVVPIVDKQVKMIDEVSVMVRTMDKAVGEINRTLAAHGEHAIESLRVCNESRNASVGNAAKLDAITDRMAVNSENTLRVLKEIEANTQPIKSLSKSDMP